MKWIFIILMTTTSLTLHAKDTARPCPAKAIDEEKALKNLEDINEKIEDTARKEEFRKYLVENKCVIAAQKSKGESKKDGFEVIRKRLLKSYQGFNAINEFCKDLGSDSTLMRRGELNNIDEDSISINNLKDSILNACVPEGKTAYETKAYRMLMRTKFKEDTKRILKSMMINLPETFSCDDKMSIYKPGHVYITIFHKKLYKLVDYLLEEINDGKVTIDQILNPKDLNTLEKMLCKQIQDGFHKDEPMIKTYYDKLFKNKKCN